MLDLALGCAHRAMPGEAFSGDFTICHEGRSHGVAILIDVLGHGIDAFRVGSAIIEPLTELARDSRATPTSLLKAADRMLQQTRGAAMAALVIHTEQGTASFASIGNVVGRKLLPDSTPLVSRDGIVGIQMCTPRETSFTIAERDLLVLYSDGIRLPTDTGSIPELHTGSAGTLARTLLVRFARPSDDASCIVARIGARENLP